MQPEQQVGVLTFCARVIDLLQDSYKCCCNLSVAILYIFSFLFFCSVNMKSRIFYVEKAQVTVTVESAYRPGIFRLHPFCFRDLFVVFVTFEKYSLGYFLTCL